MVSNTPPVISLLLCANNKHTVDRQLRSTVCILSPLTSLAPSQNTTIYMYRGSACAFTADARTSVSKRSSSTICKLQI